MQTAHVRQARGRAGVHRRDDATRPPFLRDALREPRHTRQEYRCEKRHRAPVAERLGRPARRTTATPAVPGIDAPAPRLVFRTRRRDRATATAARPAASSKDARDSRQAPRR